MRKYNPKVDAHGLQPAQWWSLIYTEFGETIESIKKQLADPSSPIYIPSESNRTKAEIYLEFGTEFSYSTYIYHVLADAKGLTKDEKENLWSSNYRYNDPLKGDWTNETEITWPIQK